MRILLVDDDPDTRHLWHWYLCHVGHHVDLAENGASAVQMAQSNSYDVVVLDVNMPLMNGWDALHRIRLLSPTKQTPVIMATAYHHSLWEEKFEQAGANRLLSKPLLPEQLLAAIEEVVPSPQHQHESEFCP